MLKKCSKCKILKKLEEFPLNKNRKGGRGSYCKKCINACIQVWKERQKKRYNGLYQIWDGMKQRCFNPRSGRYKYYGAKGIIVCQEWTNSFSAFYSWAKNKQKPGLQIDRRDNNGNYSPKNCRFVTLTENVRNSSSTKLKIKDVRSIRRLLRKGKLAHRIIGAMFGVTRRHINHINRGETWK